MRVAGLLRASAARSRTSQRYGPRYDVDIRLERYVQQRPLAEAVFGWRHDAVSGDLRLIQLDHARSIAITVSFTVNHHHSQPICGKTGGSLLILDPPLFVLRGGWFSLVARWSIMKQSSRWLQRSWILSSWVLSGLAVYFRTNTKLLRHSECLMMSHCAIPLSFSAFATRGFALC